MADLAGALTDLEPVTACDLCGGAGQRPFRTVEGRVIVRCAGCGLLYIKDRVSDERLQAIYAEDYYRARGMVADHPEDLKDSRWERLEWLPSAAAPDGTKRKLLDVGCGVGAFLADARQAGWDVAGTEVSDWSIRTASEKYGIPVTLGHVEQLAGTHWPWESFDAVTCWHNIEHQRHPMRVIRTMRDLLKPGGRLVLRTPNAASFDQWWYGMDWVGWHDPGHFYFFGLDQLLGYCDRLGLKVLHVDRGTTRALEGVKAALRAARGKSPKAGVSAFPDMPQRLPPPQPSGPAGRPGLKRTLVRAAGRVVSGRDVTILAERPAGTGGAR